MGGFAQIADLTSPTVKPASLIGDYYRRLCDYLANSHEVIPFAYDWRKSVGDAAIQLAAELDKALFAARSPCASSPTAWAALSSAR